ncbi:MAG TPA: DNA polymerase III subunit gamma/tau [bacterium]|nr:DNA polymerase III subunit gamma/tau [bacterium]
MPPQVMALKWRPQTFADMVGQEHITRTLKNAITADRVAHAYIFAGPRGVGKTTTARIFAKALNCRAPKDAEPCNACDLCEEVNQGSAMDVIEIDAASFNRVEDIRNLQEQVGTYPATAKYKVYIFDEAHRITRAAFDAFHKTLEEPPAHVIFILASTEIHQFPPTVQSRCQRFEFRAMNLDTLIRQLRRISDSEKIEVDDKALYQIARSAGGSMRDAQRTLDQLVAFSGRAITAEDIRVVLGTIESEVYLRFLEAAAGEDAGAALDLVRQVLEGGKDLDHFYSGLLEFYRHLAVAKAYPSSAASLIPLAPEEVDRLTAVAKTCDDAYVLSALRLLIEQEWAARRSSLPQVVLETLALELCRLKQLTSVAGLMGGGAASRPAAPARPAAPRPAAPTRSIAPAAPAASAPRPSEAPAPPADSEPVLAVEEIEDPVEAEKNPDLAKLKSQWREFLEKAAAQKKALQGVLVDTRPKSLEEGTLVLSCKGPFHQEQLSKTENKTLVEQILKEMLGRPVTLVPVLAAEAPPPAEAKPSGGARAPKSMNAPAVDVKELEKEEPLVAAALKMFGGKIVEVKRNAPKQL